MASSQLILFQPISIQTKPVLEKVRWSFSKMNLLRQCARAYYYEYYGGGKKTANNTDYEQIHFLKGLSNEHLVSGSIVHKVIASFLRYSMFNEHWVLDRLMGFARMLLDQTISYSDSVRQGARPILAYTPDILKEIYAGTDSKWELKKRIWEKIELNLLQFYQSEQFDFLKEGVSQTGSVIEGKLSVELPNVRIDGAIDLAFFWEDQYYIADWKTGSKDVQDTSLQLLTYALWAIEKQSVKPSQIVIQKAYLLDNSIEPLDFSEHHLTRAKVRIQQDAESIREADYFGKQGDTAAFTKCNQTKICEKCPFEKICVQSN